VNAPRLRVAYFTVVPLYFETSGGALCCLNHVRRLAGEPALELSVYVCGPGSDEPLNRAVVAPTGAHFHFIPFGAGPEGSARETRRLARRWPFLYEAAALDHPHVEPALMAELRRSDPDVVVVDYVPSASFARRLYTSRLPRVTVTLNREGDFHRELRRHGAVPPGVSASRIAELRVRSFERWVYRHSSAVVGLTEEDLPAFPGRPRIREAISPVFDRSPIRWGWSGARSLLFVGNIGHYPNRLAIEWLATRLAPVLEQVGSDVEVRVLGVDDSSVPPAWKRASMTFLGEGDRDLLTRELTRAGAFVAPIANRFGSKIKLLDCLAHGTPFFATDEALTGLPFVSRALGPIDLNDPGILASGVERCFAEPTSVVAASERLAAELDDFLVRQRGVWSDLLRRVVAAG
jgi:Glycosyl transferases group 1